ncbi:MAG: sodium transporter [Candidatus Scalindua sp. AMX11]|nr:MAG: sodium transporter [Candidatus Scalindua sp.]NOG84841.1 sodium/solute symporter [Planctomycetota bacterium]RZV84911.1 MAG: sodium transporter [Candidatus Scalindua sp. SCAELEC01]TDE65098.1 MAG: sodium transporter [Candidatus Scalindua sp. AMX11]GJQ59490.1 MAG: sodium:solute symporter [Candidatus Scalindua sp.]
MNTFDWSVIAFYLIGMIGLSILIGRKQSNQDDYYVGGRNLPWWAVGISTMATQTSAVSFISIPAFVALSPVGGLTLLQYEMAVPLSMIVVMVCLIPFFRKLELVSVYEYLELRFGSSVRYLVSSVFLISRALATGVGVYAIAIVLSVCMNTPLWLNIFIIGIVTIIYDTIGGIAAVVYSDVIQMVMLLCGITLCVVYASIYVGGVGIMFESFPAERCHTIDMSTFWGFLVGGFFLYISYYGTDQSQVQRELSAPSLDDTKRSLFFNGFARFPLAICYIILGIAVGAVFLHSTDLQDAIPADHLDYLIPQFILLFVPPGVRAILFAAILAAAMSSLDSALNSLSASTMRDFVERKQDLSEKRILLLSKLVTIMWGLIISGFAFIVGNISKTILESINMIGSAFYGPILASFLMGVLTKRATAKAVFAGVVAGVVFNLFLWLKIQELFWMWWNLLGMVVSVVVTLIISPLTTPPRREQLNDYTLKGSGMLREERRWIAFYLLLVLYFGVILISMIFIERYTG